MLFLRIHSLGLRQGTLAQHRWNFGAYEPGRNSRCEGADMGRRTPIPTCRLDTCLAPTTVIMATRRLSETCAVRGLANAMDALRYE